MVVRGRWRKRRRWVTVGAKLDLGKMVVFAALCAVSHAAKPVTPGDLWVHRLGVSELIYICLFYHSWTLPFHLFMGELAELSGNNASHHSFQLQGEKFGGESEMFIKSSVTSPNRWHFNLMFSDFFFTVFIKTFPTSCKPNSILMPTIKIMNWDGSTPSNERMSGVYHH